MKAIIHETYGSPEVLELADVDTPAAGDDGVLVRVRAASANPLDWHFLRGEPYVMRAQFGLRVPKRTNVGNDVAGVVEAVGKDVSRFKIGDEVFGDVNGSFAEYVAAPEDLLESRPANLTFEQAAAVPLAAVTALQGLRDKAQVQPGQRVLVYGAGGGVDTFAVRPAVPVARGPRCPSIPRSTPCSRQSRHQRGLGQANRTGGDPWHPQPH